MHFRGRETSIAQSKHLVRVTVHSAKSEGTRLTNVANNRDVLRQSRTADDERFVHACISQGSLVDGEREKDRRDA